MWMQKLLTFFFSKNISVLAIFKSQSFNDTLTNDTVSFEQLGPEQPNLSDASSVDPDGVRGFSRTSTSWTQKFSLGTIFTLTLSLPNFIVCF